MTVLVDPAHPRYVDFHQAWRDGDWQVGGLAADQDRGRQPTRRLSSIQCTALGWPFMPANASPR